MKVAEGEDTDAAVGEGEGVMNVAAPLPPPLSCSTNGCEADTRWCPRCGGVDGSNAGVPERLPLALTFRLALALAPSTISSNVAAFVLSFCCLFPPPPAPPPVPLCAAAIAAYCSSLNGA